MAAAPVPATQVASYFVRQYYQILQQQPSILHQFYNEASTMQRIYVDYEEVAIGLVEIHNKFLSMSFADSVIEIKSVDAQASLSAGVTVLVTGYIQSKDKEFRKPFVQSFFLAPQDNGYYVLNDIFRYSDDFFQPSYSEHTANGDVDLHMQSAALMVSSMPESAQESSSPVAEITRDFAVVPSSEEATNIENYDYYEQQELPVTEDHFDQSSNEIPSTVASSAISHDAPVTQDVSVPTPTVEEPPSEPTKHTYASILLLAKGSSTTAPPSHQIQSSKPATVPSSERQPLLQSPQQHAPSSFGTAKEAQHKVTDDVEQEIEDDGGSIYVRNLPPTVTNAELETEFKNYGKLKSEGISIIHRKEAGICFAFINYEDPAAAQAAVDASQIDFNGRQIYIEEKRNNARGRRGGRGRGVSSDGSRGGRGYGGRGYGRGVGSDSGRGVGSDSGRGYADAGRGYANAGRTSSGRGTFASVGGNSARQPRRSGASQFQNGGD